MSEQIVIASVDAGNGGTNYVIQTPKSYKTGYIPSVRAEASGASLGLKEMELQYKYADWNSKRYVFGDDVLRVSRRNLSHHYGENRYGGDFHRFMVALSLAQAGAKSGPVDLTIFIPPGMYNDKKENARQQFMNEPLEIQMKSDDKPRVYEIVECNVLPEGVGAIGAFLFNSTGELQKTDLFVGQICLMDVGVYTTDIVLARDGKLNFDMLEFATVQDAGVGAHIRTPLLRELRAKGGDFSILTEDDIDEVIRRGLQKGDWKLAVGGHVVPLKDQITALIDRFANWLASTIIDDPNRLNGLKGIKTIIPVGGGMVLTKDALSERYPNKFVNTEKIAHVKKVSPLELNAVGGFRRRMYQLSKAKA